MSHEIPRDTPQPSEFKDAPADREGQNLSHLEKWEKIESQIDYIQFLKNLVSGSADSNPFTATTLVAMLTATQRHERGADGYTIDYGNRRISEIYDSILSNTPEELSTPLLETGQSELEGLQIPLKETLARLQFLAESARRLRETYLVEESRSLGGFLGIDVDIDLGQLADIINLAVKYEVDDSSNLAHACFAFVSSLINGDHAIFARPRQPERILDRTKIEGFDITEDEINGLDNEVVQKWLEANFPPYFLRGIASIKRVSKDELNDESGPSGGLFETQGQYFPATGEIAISYDPIISSTLGKDESYQKLVRETLAPNDGTRFVSHEIAHHVHARVLGYHDLLEWELVSTGEPVAVSGYVDFFKDLEPRRLKEDFADTMKLFLDNPEALAGRAPKRFTFMLRLFNKFDPERAWDREEGQRNETWKTRVARWRSLVE